MFKLTGCDPSDTMWGTALLLLQHFPVGLMPKKQIKLHSVDGMPHIVAICQGYMTDAVHKEFFECASVLFDMAGVEFRKDKATDAFYHH
jgi:hypothetical protein